MRSAVVWAGKKDRASSRLTRSGRCNHRRMQRTSGVGSKVLVGTRQVENIPQRGPRQHLDLAPLSRSLGQDVRLHPIRRLRGQYTRAQGQGQRRLSSLVNDQLARLRRGLAGQRGRRRLLVRLHPVRPTRARLLGHVRLHLARPTRARLLGRVRLHPAHITRTRLGMGVHRYRVHLHRLIATSGVVILPGHVRHSAKMPHREIPAVLRALETPRSEMQKSAIAGQRWGHLTEMTMYHHVRAEQLTILAE